MVKGVKGEVAYSCSTEAKTERKACHRRFGTGTLATIEIGGLPY